MLQTINRQFVVNQQVETVPSYQFLMDEQGN